MSRTPVTHPEPRTSVSAGTHCRHFLDSPDLGTRISAVRLGKPHGRASPTLSLGIFGCGLFHNSDFFHSWDPLLPLSLLFRFLLFLCRFPRFSFVSCVVPFFLSTWLSSASCSLPLYPSPTPSVYLLHVSHTFSSLFSSPSFYSRSCLLGGSFHVSFMFYPSRFLHDFFCSVQPIIF